ncbi:ATP-binding protein [Rhodocytophaga rosea]|uniref:ATP-binding protein n=1 Tax=Rhodocytophaga rosea TaxID=2704465 RepID=A0A6C0GQ13_9BACT|nr:ATP-binding protein [Rhodocytophaga rosea]QHT70158.1 ATP-binding protein [Rhodocytophaga rosea]
MASRLESGITLLTMIERTFNKLKDSKLSEQNLKKVTASLRSDLTAIANFFGCTQEEALFFSLIFGLRVVCNSVYYNDIIHYLDCNPFFIVGNEHVFKSLQKKRLIIKDDNWGRNSVNLNITKEAYQAVAANKLMPHSSTGTDNLYSLLQKVDELMAERRREVISSLELFEEIQYILQTENKLTIISNIQKLHLPVKESCALLYLCFQFANGEEHTDLNEMLHVMFDSMSEKVSFKKDLLNKEAIIVQKELIGFENDYFLMGRSIKLTDKAIEELFREEAELFERKRTYKTIHARLIAPQPEKMKALFLNGEEEKQVKLLNSLLQEEKLQPVMKQFKDAGITSGIVVLLYGDPGTGKTETVYNLARQTGRHILMVDIAQMKDKYVGESEKRIKQLFSEYRKAMSYFEKIPILLFNESDALINKRIEVSSSVDQMNNSMQNILLQELEDFEGILFATSNMHINLDKAFERRFLYKVEFKLPDQETREKIWHSKVPELSQAELTLLASRYTFSGGQIDNVVRKFLLENIITGQTSSITALERMCVEEFFGRPASKIGF